jgi:hypothetical protein
MGVRHLDSQTANDTRQDRHTDRTDSKTMAEWQMETLGGAGGGTSYLS